MGSRGELPMASWERRASASPRPPHCPGRGRVGSVGDPEGTWGLWGDPGGHVVSVG